MAASPVLFALRALYAFGMLRQRAQLQPTDVPAIRSADPAADRILLVGNGPSHGWGVLTHQLALTGQLADAVAGRTKRACDADLIGAEAMNVRSALAWIGDRDLSDVDALVLLIGFNDALRLTPPATWENELVALLDGIAPRLRENALITLVGIPPISSFRTRAGALARLTDRHRRRLNTATRRIADERGIPYLDLPVDDARAPEASVAVYRHFAVGIADDLAARLLTARPKPTRRRARPDKVWDWSGTPAIVELARHGGETDLRRLADVAQKSFGVELAVVSLVDGDRLYHGTNTDVVPASVPLELSFCRYTVESGEPVIIPDTGKDPRFIDNPLVDVSFINFYAGYPLRATDGQVIGSFCLQGSQPRRESAIALDLLRQLALEAQEVLRGYETEVPQYVFEQPMPTGEPVVFDR
jgi:lysophospholipase L1-like esterase